MRGLLALLMFLLPFEAVAMCSLNTEQDEAINACYKAYSTYARDCDVGDVRCLSRSLTALFNGDFYEYRSDLNRVYPTPLMKKKFEGTPAYASAYTQMLSDKASVIGQEFCSRSRVQWRYLLDKSAFRLYDSNEYSPFNNEGSLKPASLKPDVIGYLLPYPESEALKIEEWDLKAWSQMVFFKLTDIEEVELTRVLWTMGVLHLEYEDGVLIKWHNGCSSCGADGCAWLLEIKPHR